MITVAAEAPGAVPTVGLDPEAFFDDHYPSLCRTAQLVVGDPALAEELVMDAFAAALARWPRVEAADAPVAYVRRMVVNLCVSRVRRFAAERRVRARLDPLPPATAEPESNADLLAAIAALPPRQRACVVLRYYDDLAEADIAATLGCSVGTVKSQLSKARASLAAVLAEREDR